MLAIIRAAEEAKKEVERKAAEKMIVTERERVGAAGSKIIGTRPQIKM